MTSEWKRAFSYAWLILSVMAGLVVLAPFVVSAETLSSVAPVCEARARGGTCFLCGMTRAFLHIGKGEFGDAQVLNAGSLPLYLGICANAVVAAIYGGRKCKL